jgi:hypothetical protein
MRFSGIFRNRDLMQTSLLLCGAVFLAVGVLRGEVKAILMRAIYICLECIGIG